ncbi:MAG TPA: hypothetical protein VGM89_01005 [Puia sp.]|jgi:hypothetical protein
MVDLGFDGDELGFVVVVVIEAELEVFTALILEVADQQPVAEPVKYQDSQQQYGCNLFQAC